MIMADLSRLNAADILGTRPTRRPSWPPAVSAPNTKGPWRLRTVAGEVTVQQIPLTTVQITGAVCPVCWQPLPVGSRAAIRAGTLVHVRQQCLRDI